MYTHQNLVGSKRHKNRQIMLQHIKISDLNKLRWVYGTIHKTRQMQGYGGEWPTSRGWKL